MLPPFVPPSARVPAESLPLITEFVIDRSEHASATATIAAPEPEIAHPAAPESTQPRTWTNEDVSALPSIDEFLMERPAATGAEHAAAPTAESHGEADTEAMRSADVPAAGIAPAELEREEGEPIPAAQSEIILPEHSHDASEVKESVPPGARFNDEAGGAEAEAPGVTMEEAWEASAVSPAVAGQESAQRAHEHDEWGTTAEAGTAAPTEPDAQWVAEERDAYDWRSVGTIAAGPDEARRASEAWEGTEWEPRRSPEQEQLATALVQLARRVRAGELRPDVPANATIEASLAALLAALLANGGR
jgi:hypothetical protein